LIELVLGAGLGVLVGMRRGGALDRAVVVLCVLGIASPLFVLASLAQYLFGVRWGLLPVAGVDDGLIGYVLPSMVLATIGGSFAVRLMRVETLDQLNLPHVRTARSKGISERQLTRNHVARNAMTALVTFFGLEIGALLGGTVVVERVFNLAGVGGVLGRAISQRDNVVIIGFTVFVVVVYLALDVLIDVVTMLLDPRTRVS
ncbi:MAG: ABC transporter permease, partial [Ilumatobacteraceae bacterium]|nr:ABC transporter permease [Ilumatobacteraceae bacterium]